MGISGKYDFKGIKKMGRLGFKTALAGSPFSWVLKGGAFTDAALDFISNWLANKGLIIINLGVIFVDGEFDQSGFDKAMDDGWEKIRKAGGADKLTPAQQKAIDDEVIKKFRDFARLSTKPSPKP